MKKTKDDEFPIDFVIPWVDGSDPEWIAEFNKYAPKEKRRETDASEQRYRDYGLLRYWFRGVEKFAPWVRTVHFVTCGQKPDWLNLAAPKLHWVKHSDYIPQEYLPVFSSHPIELYMHKIPGLAEQIVYFNDDFFLTSPVRKNFFFKSGLPKDSAVMNAEAGSGNLMTAILFNDLEVINRRFDKRKTIAQHFFKWFNVKYASYLLRNVCLVPWPRFTGFMQPHFAQPFKKSVIEEVWNEFGEVLNRTCREKLRSVNDVNQWLFREWQLCKGEFSPIHPFAGKKYFSLDADIDAIVSAIEKQKYFEIVLNDSDANDYTDRIARIKSAFEKILPEKCGFER